MVAQKRFSTTTINSINMVIETRIVNEDTGSTITEDVKCSHCHHSCHCDGDLHADEYGVCTCVECNCRYRYPTNEGDTPHSEWLDGYNKWKEQTV